MMALSDPSERRRRSSHATDPIQTLNPAMPYRTLGGPSRTSSQTRKVPSTDPEQRTPSRMASATTGPPWTRLSLSSRARSCESPRTWRRISPSTLPVKSAAAPCSKTKDRTAHECAENDETARPSVASNRRTSPFPKPAATTFRRSWKPQQTAAALPSTRHFWAQSLLFQSAPSAANFEIEPSRPVAKSCVASVEMASDEMSDPTRKVWRRVKASASTRQTLTEPSRPPVASVPPLSEIAVTPPPS
mmetsp:Transcript_3182/g.11387  ORF Transcript_3182/g.11387 Transcript_3182/m.11387 type:complete len:246 (-) Transcript_3182:464-1201(-)